MTNNEIISNISKSKDTMYLLYTWIQTNQITLEQFYMAMAFYLAIIKNEL